ncbi:hypothetical protein B4135_0815 [Caldibacillus debilis]|uniref:Uncharacterized protein n=1 Tax=Caldibacillus debilis TaxID=301148 RepID=A0A150M6A7_9BACI|nr:hypothetical protein B4135_0815 [Caldibacillus debilis]
MCCDVPAALKKSIRREPRLRPFPMEECPIFKKNSRFTILGKNDVHSL